MGAITDQGADAFRNDEVAGVPASGAHDPVKSEIRALFATIDGALSSLIDGILIGGAVTYSTRALLFADLGHAAGSLGVVYNDPTGAYNGVYVKSGGSGSGAWTLTALTLPASFASDLSAVISGLADEIARATAAEGALNAAKADKSVVVSGEGLVTGGGTLAGDFALTVTPSTASQASLADSVDVAVTPASLAPVVERVAEQEGGFFNRDSAPVRSAVQDGGARVAGGADRSGGWRMSFASFLGHTTMGRDSRPLAATVQGGQGQNVVSGFDAAGRLAATLLSKVRRMRDTLPYLTGVVSVSGQWALGIDQRGLTTISPSDTTRENFHLGLGALRGSWRTIQTSRLPGRLTGALVQEADGTVTPVRQRRDGMQSTALVDAAAPLRGLLVIGQSNATANSGSPYPVPSAEIRSALFPHHAMEPVGGAELGGDGVITPDVFKEIVAGADTTYGQSPRNAMLFALERFLRDRGEPSPGYLACTNFRPGTPLSWFLKDAVTGGGRPDGLIYNNILTSAQGLVSQATAYGRSIEIDIYIIHGESGPSGRSTYGSMLDDFLTDLSDDVLSIAGRRPDILLAQTNIDDANQTADGVDLAQWDVSVARADTYLTGPMYPYQFYAELVEVGGDIHVKNLDRLAMGEPAALAYRAIRSGTNWKPLQPQSASRSGAVVTIPFDVPAGAMQWDIDRVPEPSYGPKGFQAQKVSDGSSLTISSVAIDGTNIVVNLSSNPGGAVRILYAQGQDAIIDQWAGGRGNLYSEASETSAYQRLGYAVPVHPRHYAVRFSIQTPS